MAAAAPMVVVVVATETVVSIVLLFGLSVSHRMSEPERGRVWQTSTLNACYYLYVLCCMHKSVV